MSFNNKQLLTDVQSKPIPQMYDQADDTFVPLRQMEYYGKSIDNKPSPIATPKGATFLEIDTKVIYINDGVSWVVF